MLRPLLVALLLVAIPAHTAAPDPAAARVAAATAAYEDALVRWRSGAADLDAVYRWSLRWNDSARDPHAHAQRMNTLAGLVRERVASGAAPGSDGKAVDYYVAEAAVLDR